MSDLLMRLTLAVAALWVGTAVQGSPIPTYTVTDLGFFGYRDESDSIDRDAGLIRTADGSQAYTYSTGESGWTRLSELPTSLPPSVSDPFHSSTPDTHMRGAWASPASPDLAVYIYDYSLRGTYRSSGTSIMAARRGEDGVWRNVETIAFASSPPNYYGNSIVGMNARGQVLATANDGYDAWDGRGYTQSMHPSINLYDSASGTLTRLAGLFPAGKFTAVQAIGLDADGRILVRAKDVNGDWRGHNAYLLTPSYLPDAAPVPEPGPVAVFLAAAAGGILITRRR